MTGQAEQKTFARPPARLAVVDVTALPQGHDAWVVGDEPVILIDWQGAANYAR